VSANPKFERLSGVWKRLRCAWTTGHRTDICELEKIDGQLWATAESCACGHVRRPMFPGYHKKVMHEAYADCPTEWTDLY
jgi:hypothetical protein